MGARDDELHDPTGDERDDVAGARLRALDPLAGAAPYAHPDAGAMVDRIVGGGRPQPHRRRVTALLAPLAAVAAAGLTVVALAPAPAPAPIGLALPRALAVTPLGRAQASSWLGFTTTTSSHLYAESVRSDCLGCESGLTYEYDGAGALYAPAGTVRSADAVRLLAPAHPAATLDRLARWLGLRGAARALGDARFALRSVTGATTTSLSLRPAAGSGVEVLRVATAPTLGRAACAKGTDLSVALAPRVLSSTLTATVRALGVHYQLADPRYAVGEAPTPARCDVVVTLGEQVLIDGLATDQVVSATMTPSGRLVAATVPLFTLGATARVPLASPSAAEASLARQTLAVTDTAGAPIAAPLQRGSSLVVAGERTVELKGATLGLGAFSTSEGTWLLPVYELTGDAYTGTVASPVPWSGTVLAPTRADVVLRGVASNQAVVFDQRPDGAP